MLQLLLLLALPLAQTKLSIPSDYSCVVAFPTSPEITTCRCQEVCCVCCAVFVGVSGHLTTHGRCRRKAQPVRRAEVEPSVIGVVVRGAKAVAVLQHI
uniref:Secreted protein n=1 Tax=Peronospora matthiolae TaxID=2874970 RepID=A0AAV1TJL1_9STRA